MLCLLSARRQARKWARSVGGANAKRAMGDYQQAATELALLHYRAERGAAEPRGLEQRRNALPHLMQLARQAFGANRPQQVAAPWAAGGHSGFVQAAPMGPVPPGQLPGWRPPPPGVRR